MARRTVPVPSNLSNYVAPPLPTRKPFVDVVPVTAKIDSVTTVLLNYQIDQNNRIIANQERQIAQNDHLIYLLRKMLIGTNPDAEQAEDF